MGKAQREAPRAGRRGTRAWGNRLAAATALARPRRHAGTTALFDSQASPLYNITDGAVVLLFAVAVFLFMRGSRIAEAPSYLAYNLGALAERSVYSVDATEDGRLREVLLAAKGTSMRDSCGEG